MGVKGMQSWLKANKESLGQTIYLSKKHIIIDANNLLCCLFVNLCSEPDKSYRNDVYGGDMVAFSKEVRLFFHNLSKCQIVPILVFDGSVIGRQSTSDIKALKTSTVYKRGYDRFLTVSEINESCRFNGQTIIPTLVNEVFRNIVNELQINQIQTPYEADSKIAQLSQELNCAVLTNDSDFIIYDLPIGFILIDFFNYKYLFKNPQDDNTLYIKCTIFSQNKLIRQFPYLNKDCMPLLSVLLGNDYVEEGTFRQVLESLPTYRGHLCATSYNHRKIVNLLLWLNEQTLNSAVKAIKDFISSDLSSIIDMLLNNYDIKHVESLDSELESIFGKSTTKYLIDNIYSGPLHTIILDIIFKNTCYNYPLIDDTSIPSSNLVKQRSIRVAQSLLKDTRLDDESKGRYNFCIYDRIGNSYARVELVPIETLDRFGSLNNLTIHTLMNEPLDRRRMIFFDTFESNECEVLSHMEFIRAVFNPKLSNDVCFVIMLLKFMDKYQIMEHNVGSSFKLAIMTTMFYYSALFGGLNIESIPGNQYGPYLLKIRAHESKSDKDNNNAHTHQYTNYRSIMHRITQLHCMFESYRMINLLLGHVCPKLQPGSYFDGILIVRLTRLYLSNEMSCDRLIEDIPSFGILCQRVLS